MVSAIQYVPAAVPDYGGWDWDAGFAEISRPCLRHVELEVEIMFEAVAEDRAGDRAVTPAAPAVFEEDEWFAGGTSEHALQTIALNTDDAYLPEERSLRRPVLIGAGVIALATAAACSIFLI